MQARDQQIDLVVVLCGLNDFKHAYTSTRRTASGFREELSDFVGVRPLSWLRPSCSHLMPALLAHPLFGLHPSRALLPT